VEFASPCRALKYLCRMRALCPHLFGCGGTLETCPTLGMSAASSQATRLADSIQDFLCLGSCRASSRLQDCFDRFGSLQQFLAVPARRLETSHGCFVKLLFRFSVAHPACSVASCEFLLLFFCGEEFVKSEDGAVFRVLGIFQRR